MLLTSVVIPINSKYVRYKNLDIEGQNLDIEGQNLDIEGVKIKINTIDSIDIINKSNLSNSIKTMLLKIYDKLTLILSKYKPFKIVCHGISNPVGESNYRFLKR